MQVVGHTIQEQGINSACAERVFRIDVGMSKGCGDGEPEVQHTSYWLGWASRQTCAPHRMLATFWHITPVLLHCLRLVSLACDKARQSVCMEAADLHCLCSAAACAALTLTDVGSNSRDNSFHRGVSLCQQVLEIVNDSSVRRLHEPRAVNQGEPKAPDTPQGESTKGSDMPPWLQDKQPQPVAVQA